MLLELIKSDYKGCVYLARVLPGDGRCIVKMISKGSKWEQTLKKEADILGRISSRFIPRMYDFIEDEMMMAVISEYIEGETLYDYVRKKGCLCVDEATDIALKLSEIIFYLHSNKSFRVCHLDIQPKNIILKKGEVYIIDFGSAVSSDEDLGCEGIMKTVGFFRKANVKKNPYCDFEEAFATDVYGILATFYYILVGELLDAKKKTYDSLEGLCAGEYLRAIYEKIYAKDSICMSELLFSLRELDRMCRQGILMRNDNEESGNRRENTGLYEIEEANGISENNSKEGTSFGRGTINKKKTVISTNVGRVKKSMKGKKGISFLEADTRTIGIFSAMQGEGATTMTLAFASYLAGVLQKKVAVARIGEGRELLDISGIYLGDELKSEFEMFKIDYYQLGEDARISWLLGKGYDYVVVDFGDGYERNIEEIMHCSIKVVMGSVNLWRYAAYKKLCKFLRQIPGSDRWLHIVGGDVSDARLHLKKEELTGMSRVMITDPYILEKEQLDFFQKIL